MLRIFLDAGRGWVLVEPRLRPVYIYRSVKCDWLVIWNFVFIAHDIALTYPHTNAPGPHRPRLVYGYLGGDQNVFDSDRYLRKRWRKDPETTHHLKIMVKEAWTPSREVVYYMKGGFWLTDPLQLKISINLYQFVWLSDLTITTDQSGWLWLWLSIIPEAQAAESICWDRSADSGSEIQPGHIREWEHGLNHGKLRP
jgi:hypothetical protein